MQEPDHLMPTDIAGMMPSAQSPVAQLSDAGKKALSAMREVVFKRQEAEQDTGILTSAVALLFNMPLNDEGTLLPNAQVIGKTLPEQIDTFLEHVDKLCVHIRADEPFNIKQMPSVRGQRDAKEYVTGLLDALNYEVHAAYRAESLRMEKLHRRGEEAQR